MKIKIIPVSSVTLWYALYLLIGIILYMFHSILHGGGTTKGPGANLSKKQFEHNALVHYSTFQLCIICRWIYATLWVGVISVTLINNYINDDYL